MPDNKTDMTEVLADIGNPLPDNEDDFLDHETDEEKINRLEEAVAQAEAAALLNYEALRLLIDVCKEKGFEPFPGESIPLAKPVNEMTAQELIMRNKEATVRVEARKVSSKDKLGFPTREQIDEMYMPKPMSPALAALFNSLEKGETSVSFEQIGMFVKASEESQS